jgi:glucose 1-dehydrogenase
VRFAGEGARLILADVRELPIEGGSSTLSLIHQSGDEGHFVATDVWSAIDSLVSGIIEWFGRLDVMVNNAAVTPVQC